MKIYSFTTYIEADDDGQQNSISAKDLDSGMQFEVEGRQLIDSFESADNYGKEEKLTKTALAQKFGKVGDRPFTVCFEKQNGQERVLRGRMVEEETGLGRSQVIDFDIDLPTSTGPKPNYDPRMRQVDHRTLKYLIVGGVKYVLKTK